MSGAEEAGRHLEVGAAAALKAEQLDIEGAGDAAVEKYATRALVRLALAAVGALVSIARSLEVLSNEP